jgi:hypothetical protein
MARITRYMQALFFSAIFLLFLAGFNNGEIGESQFSCTLTADKAIYKTGQVPKLDVRIINEGNTSVYLVGSLDGSDMKWRLPYCYFTIEKPKQDDLIFPRCGNTNPLRAEEFKLVKPKEKFDPYETLDHYGFFGDHASTQTETFRNIGTYKIQFHYTTATQDTKTFMGNFGQWDKGSDSMKLKELLTKIPKIDIVSNVVEIRVEQ